MKIGLFGGSFNPIHKGHIEIAKFAEKKLQLDKLIFIPVYKSAFKLKHPYASPEHRVNMIKLVKPKNMEISLFEINKKGVSHTIKTIRYFSKIFKDDELFFIIGSDNVEKLHKWKGIKEIAKKAKIIVFKRSLKIPMQNIEKFKAEIINNPIYLFSSTNFRKGFLENVDLKVRKYIAKNLLYLKEILRSNLSSRRFKHSLEVAKLAKKIALINNCSAEKAWAAGFLHDITKEWTISKHKKLLSKYHYDFNSIPSFQVHAVTGMLWVKNNYLITDKEILSAILKHTALSKEMSKLDKIIFSADKVALGRKKVFFIRKLLYKDLNKGFKKIVETKHKDLVNKKILLNFQQKQIYKKWMK